jgi:hypothetical protein
MSHKKVIINNMKYPKEVKYIWQNYVPKSGQADTVQGELMRSIEKLRDEAQRNGNCNWDDGHVILSNFIKETLCESLVFNDQIKQEITEDIKVLQNYNYPQTEDEIFDRLTDRIIEWYLENKEPIPHKENPSLKR